VPRRAARDAEEVLQQAAQGAGAVPLPAARGAEEVLLLEALGAAVAPRPEVRGAAAAGRRAGAEEALP
jgi:hypothetical protein